MDRTIVAKIMSPAPVVVEPQAPLPTVYRLMIEHHIRHIPLLHVVPGFFYVWGKPGG